MKTPSLLPACERRARSAGREIADFLGQAAGKAEHALERHILAEGDQMHLVVSRPPLAGRADQASGVVELGGAVRRLAGIADAQASHQHPGLGFASDVADSVPEDRIGGVERRRRLRPDDQIRVRDGAGADRISWIDR